MAASLFSMNEQALSMMQAGNYEPAARILHQGISKLEDAYAVDQEYEMDCEQESSSQLFTFSPAKQGPSYQHNDLNCFKVYTSAMALQTNGPQDQVAHDLASFAEEDYNLLASVLLFNYGLCLHLCGLYTGRENHLQDSLDAYEEALGLLGMIEQSPCTFLLELAILNNHGHINHCFMETRYVHDCLQRMRVVLHEATLGWAKTVPEELSSFAHNILYNTPQIARPAPAA